MQEEEIVQPEPAPGQTQKQQAQNPNAGVATDNPIPNMPPQNQYMPPQTYAQAKPPMSIVAIIGLVLAAVALATSFIPIINNGSFFIALAAFVLCIIGIVQTKKNKKSGRAVAIIGLIFAILACIFTLTMQAACSAALDEAGLSTSSENSSSADGDSEMVDAIYDSNGIVITIGYMESSLGFASFPISITNNSGEDVNVSIENVSCDGVMADTFFYETVTDGKIAEDDLLLTNVSSDNAISVLEGDISISYADTYMPFDSSKFTVSTVVKAQ